MNIYDLATMQSVEEFVFTSPVTMLEFGDEGKKLVVLTSNQVAHIFDISSFLN